MSGHLPECLQTDGDCPCICDRLRAAEQRVRDELPPNGADALWYLLGQRKGVQAARDAVEAMRFNPLSRDQGPNATKRQALAAIDALPVKGSGNSHGNSVQP